MKTKTLILVINLIIIGHLAGQDQSALRLNIQGYNVIFPGLEVAYQQPIWQIDVGKKKAHQFLINGAAAADCYAYWGNHTGFGLTGEVNIQHLSEKGFLTEVYGGFGLLTAVLAGEVYEQNEQGNFEKSRLKGNVYSNWKTGFGVSKRQLLPSGKMVFFNLRAGIRRADSPGGFILPNASVGITFLINPKKEKR